ncbi:MAG: prepilin-type N-terminal cleavage/methylation domain-containing protein [Synechococcus sp.]
MGHECQRTGFTLIELLLAAAIALVVFGAGLNLLLGEARQGSQLAQGLLLRRLQRRTLRLVRDDLRSATRWEVAPEASADWPCPLSGRQPLLAIRLSQDTPAVLYSLGPAPSPIWVGPVLMRCGPAFDLQGRPSSGRPYQNRVVLDAIHRFRVEQPTALPVLDLMLEQRIEGTDQLVRSSAVG